MHRIVYFLHVKQAEGVYVPRCEDLLELSFGVWLPVLAAFELHSPLSKSQFLALLGKATESYHDCIPLWKNTKPSIFQVHLAGRRTQRWQWVVISLRR